ncbi:MAG: NAD(+)/NADH kinase, partial [Succinatimonas sp.]|nr:NAD(+)/NADH kinase [Succinatimonas sp.]
MKELHKKNIKSAVILSKVYHRPVAGAIREIACKLRALGVEPYLDQNTSVGFDIPEIPSLSRSQMSTKDLFIVVGGDGSLLGAARTLVDLRVPMLGVNRGHLGLLTDVSPSDLGENLKKIVAGRYSIEQRT